MRCRAMKTSTEVSVSHGLRDSYPYADGSEERHKPSGFHRIGHSRAERSLPARVLSEVRVSRRRFDASNWLTALIAGAALTCQFLVHDELGLALVALSPLLLIALRSRDSKSAFQAAALWLLSACAELLHPPIALSESMAQPPHRVI